MEALSGPGSPFERGDTSHSKMLEGTVPSNILERDTSHSKMLEGTVPSNILERDTSAVKLSGYLKNLWQSSRSSIDRRPFFLNGSRERLELSASWAALRAYAAYDHEQLAGSFFRTKDYQSYGLGESEGFLDTDQHISTADTFIWRHRLYRWWAALETDATLARAGRQRIAWGTAKLFQPTDVLNPYNPLSVERDERPGIDAVYVRQAMGAVSQAELAWAAEDRWSPSALLGRLKTNWLSTDLAVMGGKTPRSERAWIVGGEAARSLADGTLRADWSYSDPGWDDKPYWQLSVGYDYAFTQDAALPGLKDLSLMFEYFRNGAGMADAMRYDVAAALAGTLRNLAKDYAGFGLTKDIHPLLKFDLTVILNLNDSSCYAGPSLTWDAGENLFLSAGFQRFAGAWWTEYGRLPNLGFLQWQRYF